MAGLLDSWGKWTGDPDKDAAIGQGLLGAAFRMMSARGNTADAIGQGGLAGLGTYNATLAEYGNNNLRKLQGERMTADIAQQKADDERRTKIQALPATFYRNPQQTALAQGAQAGSVGPTMANAKRAETAGPSFDFPGYAGALAQYDPAASMSMTAALQKPTRKLTSVAPGASLYDEGTGQVAFTAPDKANKTELARLLAEMEQLPPGSPARRDYMASIAKMTTHAPGTSVNVNTGQKGFDNTLKLRGEFKSEPIYKAHQEVQSAYSQIQQSLKLASPAGDLAGATKIMKLLDPGSVVRESELGMAMAASGLMDRIQNYAQLTLSGQKLTPTQRKDFQTLADKLYGESVTLYNTKRGEYKGIADRNGLPEADVIGAPSTAPAAGNGWGITRVPGG